MIFAPALDSLQAKHRALRRFAGDGVVGAKPIIFNCILRGLQGLAESVGYKSGCSVGAQEGEYLLRYALVINVIGKERMCKGLGGIARVLLRVVDHRAKIRVAIGQFIDG